MTYDIFDEFEPGAPTLAPHQKRPQWRPAAKLTADLVTAIRVRLRAGDVQCTIARDFKVTPSCINQIAKGRIWRDVK